MEKKHREILIKQRANLVENLNMRDGLYTQLITRKVLNQRMVRSIQNGRTLDQQAEELLNVLETRGRNAFQHFCDALRADFQEEIVELYLEPDASSEVKDEETNSVQETVSVSGSEESQDSAVGSRQRGEVNTKGSACKGDDKLSRSKSDAELTEVSKSVAPLGLSICEEFQQQTYRRSFEPSVVRASQDSVDSAQPGYQKTVEPYALSRCVRNPQETELDRQARIFYENSILHPDKVSGAVFSVTNGQRLVSPGSPYKLEKDSVPLLERDSSPFRTTTSLPKYNSPVKNAMNPSIHEPSSPSSVAHLLSYKDNIGNFCESPHKIQPPLVFQSLGRDLNGAKILGKVDHSVSKNDLECAQIHADRVKLQNEVSVKLDTARENQSGGYRGDAGTNVAFKTSLPDEENNLHRQSPYLTSSSIQFSDQRNVNERDFIEFQAYREMQASSSEGREMLTLPRHIEMMYQEKLTEEEQNIGENSIPRLARLDSVDTMNKRPFAEHQEINTKRQCQERNPLSELTKPEKLRTLKVYDNVDNEVIKIPVIDEPKLQPAPPVVVIETQERHHVSQKMSLIGVMDDPEIDLTDGPVNVRVEVSSKQFYLANYKQAYPMRRIPRGKALILNVNEVVGKSPRRGTDIDRDNLHNLLCQLHFDVTVYNDSDGLTAKEMCLKLQQFSQHRGHQEAECAIVCILSHGEEGYIFGADGKKFELDAIFELFDNTSCRHLLGKPKVFIIQACRGGALDKGVTYSLDEHDGSDAKIRQVPSMSDMLICYPTQMGYYAWRNRDRGSWYVEALVQVFMKYAKCEDLCTMLNRVNLLVSKKVSHCPQVEMDQMCQMSEYKSTLRMPHLYFFPGIAGDLYR